VSETIISHDHLSHKVNNPWFAKGGRVRVMRLVEERTGIGSSCSKTRSETDLKPLLGCRRINGQNEKPLKLHIRNLAIHELDSHVLVLVDHLLSQRDLYFGPS